MNLTNLPKSRAYLEPTKENLMAMCKRFNVEASKLPKNHKDLEPQARYEYFMKLITGHKPCLVCNGPQGYSRQRERSQISSWLYPNGVFCLNHPSHTAAYNMAIMTMRHAVRNAKVIVPDGMEMDECQELQELGLKRLQIALGHICDHGEYLADCPPCLDALRYANEVQEERIDKVVVEADNDDYNEAEQSSIEEEMSSVFAH